MQNLELNTFEYEYDLAIGTLQIEQIENGTKIIVELFPENQSKESFESAEFSQVYDILDLAPLCSAVLYNISFPLPEGATKEQEKEINVAIVRGIRAMLETTLNWRDFKDHPSFAVMSGLRRNYVFGEIAYFITYRATEPIEIEEVKNLEMKDLENIFRIIDTINETDEERTENLLKYIGEV